ncbi:hypothetical protein PHYBLDRAFT_141712 [Phycomyces blakesleeanus NRRL 1555(-)]|uniref:Uncharacterized protein n=1 Tax=Phycomyces blakesleeanus (strain ATCC 8743b / DSM 1359 / FGSC 10004 / NBRC 33097 / NRRL 1555) TaxID=763407 RepID=A0A167PG50_PHYB8|nr:hypothetical protein PHYBLDRAFT_141712 [Phycomyces blakesleeanus NRRL 1555(-)]OAD77848.1 hypothetical protein PHYBLDRAFT_141712 [Phycomyces blakesleeanus NRRL 1555(-)]|eukprot:XP_018295888.1 hypothetical protein PHYBLDRAFT_141712 [Phycomyces blakesleeanus NRRL 1555(-)]
MTTIFTAQAKQQGSKLKFGLQFKYQGSDLKSRLLVHTFFSVFTCFLSYWPNVSTIRLHNEEFVFLPVQQSKPAIMNQISVHVLAVNGNEQGPIKFNAHGSGFHKAEELGLDIHPDLQIYIFLWAIVYWLFYLSIVFTVKENHQGSDLHPCFHRPNRRTKISSASTVTVYSQERPTIKMPLSFLDFGSLFTIEAITQDFIVHAGLQSRLLIEIPLLIWVHADYQYSAIRRGHTKDQDFSLHPGSQTFKPRDKLSNLNNEPQCFKSDSNDQASNFHSLIKFSVFIMFPLNILGVMVNDQDPAINPTP